MQVEPQESASKIHISKSETEEDREEESPEDLQNPMRRLSYKYEKRVSMGQQQAIVVNPLIIKEEQATMITQSKKNIFESRYEKSPSMTRNKKYLPPITRLQSGETLPVEFQKQIPLPAKRVQTPKKDRATKETSPAKRPVIKQSQKSPLQIIRVLPRDPNFVYQPIIPGFILLGTVNRIRMNKKQSHNRYQYVVSKSNQQIMVGEPKTCRMSSLYEIRKEIDIIATLESNFSGSKFELKRSGETNPSCTIEYKSNVCGNTVREFKVTIHRQNTTLQTKQPKHNPRTDKYTLFFDERANISSLKNFILIDPPDESTNVVLMGKMRNDEFSLDVSSSVSPLEAFAIALSSFDPKLVCQ